MLLAVGDGNHSLATAKAYWNEIRETLSPAERATHPARFAMCEIENIHDEALLFEPIHRLLSGTDPALLLSDWAAYAAARSMTLSEEGGRAQLPHDLPEGRKSGIIWNAAGSCRRPEHGCPAGKPDIPEHGHPAGSLRTR